VFWNHRVFHKEVQNASQIINQTNDAGVEKSMIAINSETEFKN
jgi:hypothetical protein